MPPHGTDDIVALAQTAPVPDLPDLIAALAKATAICNVRLLSPPPTAEPTNLQLVDRKEAARVLGVSVFFLEGKRLPCETRAGRKILYNRQKLEQYIRTGHVPYEAR